MGRYPLVVSDVSLGTSTAKTELSGDRSGNSTDLILPAACRGILAVEPYLYQITPTANQTVVASLKVESDDLGLKDYEVFAPPIGGAIATTNSAIADLMRTALYPLYEPTRGGEKVAIYGIPQTANAAAPYMGATLWWTDDPRELVDRPFRARIGGTAGGAGSGTNTGTAAATVTGATLSLSGGDTKTIRTLTGILAPTTLATVKPIAGYFRWSSPEMAFTAYGAGEPMQGPLGTAQSFAHLTRLDNLSIPVRTPTTINQDLILTAAPSTTGNFYQGLLYN